MFGMFSKKSENIQFPTDDWFQANQTPKETPDISRLENRSHHLLFATGETMRSGYNHETLNGSEFFGNAFTKSYFQHWKMKLGLHSFSIPIRSDDPKPALVAADGVSILPIVNNAHVPSIRIKGELYLVPTEKLIELDKDKDNGIFFLRERTSLLLPYKRTDWIKDRSQLEKKLDQPLEHAYVSTTGIATIKAWIYTGIQSHWEPKFDGGFEFSAVRVFRPTRNVLGNYSYFSQLEYDDK